MSKDRLHSESLGHPRQSALDQAGEGDGRRWSLSADSISPPLRAPAPRFGVIHQDKVTAWVEQLRKPTPEEAARIRRVIFEVLEEELGQPRIQPSSLPSTLNRDIEHP